MFVKESDVNMEIHQLLSDLLVLDMKNIFNFNLKSTPSKLPILHNLVITGKIMIRNEKKNINIERILQ